MSSDKFVSPVPLPSDYERELLQIFEEECCEAAQRASKIHRFGAEDIQGGPDSGYENNVQRLSVEFGQLLAMADMLAGLGFIDLVRAAREKPLKIAKVEQFLQHDNAAGMEPRKCVE